MKIINVSRVITGSELYHYLAQHLNAQFRQQRQIDMVFEIVPTNGAVEIFGPEPYEGFLFHIEIQGNELMITRSEHYVDDVNSVTIESILNSLFEGLAGEKGVKITLEG